MLFKGKGGSMKLLKLITIVSVAALFVGCGSKAAKKPDWIMKGSGAFPGDKGTRIYGVGVGNPSPNIALQRTVADDRSRQQLAAILNTTVKRLIRDFMEEHKNWFNPEASGSDEFNTVVSKNVTKATLVGSQIIDRWEDPKSGALYSLAVMDLQSSFYDQYKKKMKQAIRNQHRAIVAEKRKEAESQLDAEIDKQQKRENEILGIK